MGTIVDTEDLRNRVHREFPELDNWAYLDAAFFVPLPMAARTTLQRFHAGDLGTDVYGWRALVNEAKERLAAFHGAEASSFSYMRNTSEAFNAFVQALDAPECGNVIVLSDDHPLTMLPWRRVRGDGLELRAVELAGPDGLDGVREALDSTTIAVSLSWVNSVSGYKVDLEALSSLCARWGVALCVDAVQGMGALAVDLGNLDIALWACGGHKWMCGPHGVGYLYCHPRWIDRLTPTYVSAEGFEDTDSVPPIMHGDARRFDLGNPNYGGILALDASLSLLRGIGMDTVTSQVTALAGRLRARLKEHKLRVAGHAEEAVSGITSFELPNPEGFARLCADERVRLSVRQGLVRISTHFFNTVDHVDQVVDLAVAWRRQHHAIQNPVRSEV